MFELAAVVQQAVAARDTVVAQDTAAIRVLPHLVEGFTANIVAYAVLLAAIATVAMALVELLKAVFGIRRGYHQREVRRWIGADGARAYDELLVLAVAGREGAGALFDQPTDRMMAQIQAAANVALDFPGSAPALYGFLTVIPPAEEADAAPSAPPPTSPARDADQWRSYAAKLERGDAQPEPDDSEEFRRATRARARLDNFASRKLDAFQARTEHLWARANQTVAVVGAFVFIFVLLTRADIDANLAQRAVLALFGGMLAPFAKDIVSALSDLKARP